MSQTIPDNGFVIIVGAMKAGTTSLFDYLKAHPAICPAIMKEPEYFTHYQHHGFRARGINIKQYSDLWQFDPSQHRYALEASTGYTKVPLEQDVAKRIADYGVRPKIIYIVRDPFERILSHRNFVKNYEWAEEQTFELMIDISNYFKQLSEFIAHFPSRDILILDFEELTQDPRRTYGRVLNFLDLPDVPIVSSFTAHNVTRRESNIENVVRTALPPLKQLLHASPVRLRKLGLAILEKFPKSRKVTLSASERHKIHELLHSDMLKFANAFDIDVSKWGFEDNTYLGSGVPGTCDINEPVAAP